MERVCLVLATLGFLAACRHPQAVREEYQVSDQEAVACGDDIAVLEEMRLRLGYGDAAWVRAETSLNDCLRRQRDYEAKRARGEPANQDEKWRADWEAEQRARDAAEIAERARVAEEMRAQVQRGREERDRQERAQEAFGRKPANAQRAWSALACASQRKRLDAKVRIVEEKRYANEGGGIVDQVAIYREQLAMRFADKTGAEARRQLAAIGRPPLVCSSPPVKMIAACYRSFDAPCDPGAAEPYLAITRERLNAVVGEMTPR